jgi:hypothetical protein
MSPPSAPADPDLEDTATTEPEMNTYDPSDHIRYIHLSGPADARTTHADSGTGCSTLPSGYANQSPRTRLQRRQARVRGNRAEVDFLTA